ncbi:MAG: hypothetical protein U5L01_06945 [Rheinheimera sp.]|nr:hypothetical protein [Rheinheimera sp.]
MLGLQRLPVNWPLGDGPTFQGVYDRAHKRGAPLRAHRPAGPIARPVSVGGLDDPPVAREARRRRPTPRPSSELEMLDGAGDAFDLDAVLAGELTPVFFGSAVNNFGVQLLLDGFLETRVRRRQSAASRRRPCPIEPARPSPKFSGFVFKIQANMDPKHRDRIAFLRVCSGKFERDMVVTHQRTGKTSPPLQLAQAVRQRTRNRG